MYYRDNYRYHLDARRRVKGAAIMQTVKETGVTREE